MKISNKTYDILKWIAQIALPAIGTLYFALTSIWGLPYGEQIIGTITAIDAFLGVILGLSASQYKQAETATDGNLVIDESDPAKDVFRFEFTKALEELKKQGAITLTIGKKQDTSQ